MQPASRRLSSLALSTAITFGATACTGGGSSANNQAASDSGVKITQQNATDIIHAAFSPQDPLVILSETFAEIFADNASSTTITSTMMPARLSSENQKTRSLEALGLLLSSKNTSPPSTSACAAGGTTTTSYTDVNGDGLGAGDSIIVQFNACNSGNLLLDGGVTIKALRLSPNMSDFDISVELSFDQLSAEEDDTTAKLDGKITFDLLYDRSREELLIDSDGMDISINGESISYSKYHLYSMHRHADQSWITDFDFTASGSLIGGKLIVETGPVLRGDENISWNPISGVLTFTGESGSYVSLDAGTGNPDTVMLTVNGESQVMLWDDLDL